MRRPTTRGALTLHHGRLLWGAEFHDVAGDNARYPISSYFSLQKQAGGPLPQARTASIINHFCEEPHASRASFTSVSYQPDTRGRFRLRLGSPALPGHNPREFTEALWSTLEDAIGRWTTYPSGDVLFEYAPSGSIESQFQTYELSLLSLLKLLEPYTVWPPTASLAEEISSAFQTRPLQS